MSGVSPSRSSISTSAPCFTCTKKHESWTTANEVAVLSSKHSYQQLGHVLVLTTRRVMQRGHAVGILLTRNTQSTASVRR